MLTASLQWQALFYSQLQIKQLSPGTVKALPSAVWPQKDSSRQVLRAPQINAMGKPNMANFKGINFQVLNFHTLSWKQVRVLTCHCSTLPFSTAPPPVSPGTSHSIALKLNPPECLKTDSNDTVKNSFATHPDSNSFLFFNQNEGKPNWAVSKFDH